MDAGVIAAIIGGIATITAAIIAAVISRQKEQREKREVVPRDEKSVHVRDQEPTTSTEFENASPEMRVQSVPLSRAGVERIAGKIVYLPHRRRFEINQDPATKANLKEEIEKSAAWAKAARAKDILYDFLEWWYKPRGYPLLERFDPRTGRTMKYPVTVFPAPTEQEDKPESILGNLDPSKVEERYGTQSPFVIVDDWAWFQRMALRPDDYHDDGVKYISRSIEKKPLRISGALGWYFDALRTCDGLEREILDLFGQHEVTHSDFERVARQLPLRAQLEKKVVDPILSGEGRSVALAMSVLVIYRHNNRYHGLIEWRSSKTAVHSDLYHVVPSFMFAPEYGQWHAEWNVWHQFQREFLEEVIGEKSVETPLPEKDRAFDWFYAHPELAKLATLRAEGRAQFRLTGIAVNLLSLRPEICGILLIDDREWLIGTGIHYNWEFADADEARCRGINQVLSVPINTDRMILDVVDFTPAKVVPAGSAALWLGVDMARRVARIGRFKK